MQVATGKSILNGIAIGPLRIYKKDETETTVNSSLTPEEEYARFDAAVCLHCTPGPASASSISVLKIPWSL